MRKLIAQANLVRGWEPIQMMCFRVVGNMGLGKEGRGEGRAGGGITALIKHFLVPL